MNFFDSPADILLELKRLIAESLKLIPDEEERERCHAQIQATIWQLEEAVWASHP